MSEPDEVLAKRPRRTAGLKVIAAAVFGLILFFGLCQVGFHLDRDVHDGGPSTIDALGGLGFALSAVALLVGILIAGIDALSNLVERRKR